MLTYHIKIILSSVTRCCQEEPSCVYSITQKLLGLSSCLFHLLFHRYSTAIYRSCCRFHEHEGRSHPFQKQWGFFMRRSFMSDPLYWVVFTEYIQNQLQFGDQPLEFFLEGTRSRTGKFLQPRLGRC